MRQKKLYRSGENTIFAGIFGGLGEYFDVDPVILRLIFVLIAIFSGFFPGVLFYILAIFIVPKKSESSKS